jgi:hypothetical protein
VRLKRTARRRSRAIGFRVLPPHRGVHGTPAAYSRGPVVAQTFFGAACVATRCGPPRGARNARPRAGSVALRIPRRPRRHGLRNQRSQVRILSRFT